MGYLHRIPVIFTLSVSIAVYSSAMVVKDSSTAQIIATASANLYRANEYGIYSHGVIKFEQVKDADSLHVRIRGRLKSIEPFDQDHAFIIHNGPASWEKGCSELGGHFNPKGTQHGAPNDAAANRHVGDLGNIYVNRFGFADIHTNDDLIQVGTSDASFDIIGKTLALHYLADDFGRGNNTRIAIDNGAIIACGNIEVKIGSAHNLSASRYGLVLSLFVMLLIIMA